MDRLAENGMPVLFWRAITREHVERQEK